MQLFSFGKSEKRCFSAGEQGSPLRFFPGTGVFDNLRPLRGAAKVLLHPRQAEGDGDGVIHLLHLLRVQPAHVLAQAALVDGPDLLQ